VFGHLAGETSFALTMIVYKSVYVLCGILILIILVLLYRQNVVIVGAGRISRSAKFATSSELLYLLNLLYNMPSECCDEYKLIQLYQKSSVRCFAFSHTSTFELIPAVATAQPGALVTISQAKFQHIIQLYKIFKVTRVSFFGTQCMREGFVDQVRFEIVVEY